MKGNKVSILFLLTLAMLFLMTFQVSLSAEERDDSITLYKRIYGKALRDVISGTADEKIDGAIKLGSHRVVDHLRPLGEELNKGLADPEMRKVPSNDPYVKSHIAWAMGRIGHRYAIPYLVSALNTTDQIAREQIQKAQELKKKRAAEKSFAITLIPDRPGPAMMEDGPHPYTTSPDVYWSVADSMKSEMGIPHSGQIYRLKAQGYNYVNLEMTLIRAIGDVGHKNTLYFKGLSVNEESTKLLDTIYSVFQQTYKSQLPGIRGATALALGDVGTPRALEILQGYYASEKDFSVKVRIARGILMNDRTQAQYYQFILAALPNLDLETRRQAAIALRELKMGESVFALRDALTIENDPALKEILLEAIHYAEIDNILPINY